MEKKMTREEKIKALLLANSPMEVNASLASKTAEYLAKEIMTVIDEPTDDLNPNDICEVWNYDDNRYLRYYDKDGKFVASIKDIREDIGSYWANYRKLDLWDMLDEDVSMVQLFTSDKYKHAYSLIGTIERPEGR